MNSRESNQTPLAKVPKANRNQAPTASPATPHPPVSDMLAKPIAIAREERSFMLVEFVSLWF
jgi:hypothetical protein